MNWRQFLTPVKSVDADAAKAYLADKKVEDVTILDVRQPKEYESGHIPGAVLAPLPGLTDHLDKIDKNKPVMVYCAVGGRSRVAAQLLSGQGFKNILNLSGGFKAWTSDTAFLGEEKGLALFDGVTSVEQALTVAYSLEAGLKDFYETMAGKVDNDPAKQLFQKLSQIEIKHQERILKQYAETTGKAVSHETFESQALPGVLEGGLTTEEYANLLMPSYDTVSEIIELAMSIEAQALDLYLRASEKAVNDAGRKALVQIANEEKTHLRLLGELMEETLEGK
ncbi:sulfurtransferase [Desulfosarcina ovata subsp. sediminis]|uniref:Sulfurtransferase n=1 Tax=Desulfosarcina ovata subsp. sediminis TaxID=885957 RepID=A0A5K7ZWF3_9BACT|nr:rhodanese-like domain-containing protein [Desulfosarcina ovata]BBO84441.1 sulfurtransferase [Desulfosarcina ovata subsp. sediminis]